MIAVLSVLLLVSARLLSDSGAQARKTSIDVLQSLVEQARTEAITSRSTVALAFAEPGDLPVDDGRCRIGMFRVGEWPSAGSKSVDGFLLSRWRVLEQGVVLIAGEVDGMANPLDSDELTISYLGGGETRVVTAHGLAFHSRGGLRYPEGSNPVAVRVAEGRYESGVALPTRRGESSQVAESVMKIGRVIARPFRIGG